MHLSARVYYVDTYTTTSPYTYKGTAPARIQLSDIIHHHSLSACSESPHRSQISLYYVYLYVSATIFHLTPLARAWVRRPSHSRYPRCPVFLRSSHQLHSFHIHSHLARTFARLRTQIYARDAKRRARPNCSRRRRWHRGRRRLYYTP